MKSQPQSDHIETSGVSKTLKRFFFFSVLKQRYWVFVSLVPEVEGGVSGLSPPRHGQVRWLQDPLSNPLKGVLMSREQGSTHIGS